MTNESKNWCIFAPADVLSDSGSPFRPKHSSRATVCSRNKIILCPSLHHYLKMDWKNRDEWKFGSVETILRTRKVKTKDQVFFFFLILFIKSSDIWGISESTEMLLSHVFLTNLIFFLLYFTRYIFVVVFVHYQKLQNLFSIIKMIFKISFWNSNFFQVTGNNSNFKNSRQYYKYYCRKTNFSPQN